MSTFKDLDDWLKALLLQLSPQQVLAVNRKVAYEIRRSQRERIARQRNPDGSAYKPRKDLRGKAGGIKRRAMFIKLRTVSHMRMRTSAAGIEIGYTGRSAQIALAHQHGTVRTSSSGQKFVTPKRELLGLSDEDLELIAEAYLRHLEEL